MDDCFGDTNGGSHSDDKNPFNYLASRGEKLFAEEVIGAEHGEGFSGYRPRGALQVDVEFLNDRMRSSGLRRIRHAMKPDEAFGLIFSWDNVLADTRAMRLHAWNQLGREEGRDVEKDARLQRSMGTMPVRLALREVFGWVLAEDDEKRFIKRLAELYCDQLSQIRVPIEGLREWLEAVSTAGVPCAVASSLDRLTLLAALDRMGLRSFFQAIVTEEDGMDSIAHRFLSAAVKLDRPPSKCVVFEDDPSGITAAHNCSMKAVALIGPHPAYELQQADLAIGTFSDLSVINLRRLFAARGVEFMDLQKQLEDKKPVQRRIRNDTIF
eukprot:jgi/Mesen1/6979/ME000362S06108